MSADHDTSALAPLVARFYDDAPLPLRVRLLNGLLLPVGPLALVALGAGAFASLLPHAHWHAAVVSSADALRISAEQVLELARYVEQKCPEWLVRVPDLLGDRASWAASLSGSMLLAALRRRSVDVAAAADNEPQPSSMSPL
jgi:hypothetical protein